MISCFPTQLPSTEACQNISASGLPVTTPTRQIINKPRIFINISL